MGDEGFVNILNILTGFYINLYEKVNTANAKIMFICKIHIENRTCSCRAKTSVDLVIKTRCIRPAVTRLDMPVKTGCDYIKRLNMKPV